jgi:glycosyltransferase involved in cell wall biosynthesis
LFEEARLLFIASKEEGFGFPALKAQLSGVPVVAADAGALPEVCGEAALLVDPDDPDQMAEMLTQALFNEELRAYLIEKGRKNAARFSWDSTAKGVLQVYELLF